MEHEIPALETAATKGGPDVWPMPASMMGCLIPRSSVRGVLIDMVFDMTEKVRTTAKKKPRLLLWR